jgi:hypothetical protein
MEDSMTFFIESGVPMPAGQTRRKYPFRDMQIGQSFAVAKGEGKRLRMAAAHMTMRTDMRFVVRASELEVRCWRVE